MKKIFNHLLLLLCTTAFAAAANQSGNLTLKTLDGTEIRGLVMTSTVDEVTIQNASGIFTLKRSQLVAESKASLSKLEAPDEPEALRKKIVEQEQTIAALRAENQQLRAALAQNLTPSAPTSSSAIIPGTAQQYRPLPESSGGGTTTGGYWISSTGKRHNSSCRYYKTSIGRAGEATEGVACKICGG